MGEYKEYDNLLYVTVEVVLKNGTDLNQVKDNLTVENFWRSIKKAWERGTN